MRRPGGRRMDIHPRIRGIDVSGLGGIWVYLVRGERVALVDTGPKQPLPLAPVDHFPQRDVPPLAQLLPAVLEDMDLTVEDIDLAVITHIHFDHCGGNAAIKAASGAEISIHATEAHYFDDPGLLFEHEQASVIERILGKDHVAEVKRRYLEEFTGPGPYVALDSTFVDGDTVDLGGGCELTVVHLPGHSAGSVGFYWEKEGILLAGDSLQGPTEGERGCLPILDDPAAFRRSLERAQQLPLRKVVHAHPCKGLSGSRTLVREGDDIPRYLQECQQFMETFQEAVQEVSQDLDSRPFTDIYDEVIDRLPQGIGLRKWQDLPKDMFFSPATLLFAIEQVKSEG
jgi:glyoxylase-like metal-dependent hydrolase (beta-lactamase superfamily II)